MATEDIEVAGADISRPIIQVAAIAVASNLQELETFEAKLKFDRRLADPHTLTKNRYCPATWQAEARSATAVAREYAKFLRRHATLMASASDGSTFPVAELAAHNANFDGRFLQAWFERSDVFFPGHYRMLCTMQRAQWLFHERHDLTAPKDFKLGTLCRYFGVPFLADKAHEALADVRATVELYRRMSALAEAAPGHADRESQYSQACRLRRSFSATTCRSRRRRRRQTCRRRRGSAHQPGR